MKLPIQQGIILLIAVLLSGCGLFENDDTFQPPYELNPEAVCTNSSTDEWTLLGLREETIYSILVHPQNPHVIFAGTGFDFSAQRDGKIYRSTDCGQNWEKVYEGGSFRGLLLHPNHPYTLFAWHHRPTGGLLRSTDGGDTWKLHSDGMHTNGENLTSVLLIHPNNPSIMYASTSGFGSGALYKSTNDGNTWENITMNHWPHLASGATAMFMHPDQPELLLHSANMNETLSRSTDGGDAWKSVFVAEGLVKAYAMNTESPDQIIGASSTFSKAEALLSNDRGKTWEIKAMPDSLRGFRSIIFIKDTAYLATEGGVLKTENFETYTFLNEGINFGRTEEGHALTIPRTITADKLQQNIYIGHSLVPLEEEIIGGVYVRKLE